MRFTVRMYFSIIFVYIKHSPHVCKYGFLLRGKFCNDTLQYYMNGKTYDYFHTKNSQQISSSLEFAFMPLAQKNVLVTSKYDYLNKLTGNGDKKLTYKLAST